MIQFKNSDISVWKKSSELNCPHEIKRFETEFRKKKLEEMKEKEKKRENHKVSKEVMEAKIPAVKNINVMKGREETQSLTPFFHLIDIESPKCCYGVEDTVFAIESGAAETVFVWKYFAAVLVINNVSGKKTMQQNNSMDAYVSKNKDSNNTRKMKVLSWLRNNCKNYNTEVKFMEGHSEEGMRFCKGFGIAAILRYGINLPSKNNEETV